MVADAGYQQPLASHCRCRANPVTVAFSVEGDAESTCPTGFPQGFACLAVERQDMLRFLVTRFRGVNAASVSDRPRVTLRQRSAPQLYQMAFFQAVWPLLSQRAIAIRPTPLRPRLGAYRVGRKQLTIANRRRARKRGCGG